MGHKRYGRALAFTAPILASALLIGSAGLIAGAPQGKYAPASTIVQPQAYVSMAPVPRGHAFEIAVVAKITAGYHVNAHVPSEEYLIPTKVTADLPSGVTLVVTAYPRGMVHQFQFAPAGLRVYEGSFTVRMRLRAAANAPLGQQKIPLTVAYQACNEEACLPPTKVPAVAEFAVAAEDAPSHPANPEVFSENTKTPAAH